MAVILNGRPADPLLYYYDMKDDALLMPLGSLFTSSPTSSQDVHACCAVEAIDLISAT